MAKPKAQTKALPNDEKKIRDEAARILHKNNA